MRACVIKRQGLPAKQCSSQLAAASDAYNSASNTGVQLATSEPGAAISNRPALYPGV